MKRLLPLLFFALFNCLSCGHPNVVYIQPLGDVEKADIDLIKHAVESFYHIKCIVKPAVRLTIDIQADSKTRYEANRILSKYDSNDNLLIVTESDIAYNNHERHVKEWGIFGLAYTPGTTCVISTFRLKRNASKELFRSRLVKACLHEVGHNRGLKHCTSGDKRCFMNDARGSIKVVDQEQVFLCEKCRKQL